MVTLNPYLNFPGTAEEAFNFYLSLNTESEEETKDIFDKLSAGGKIEVPLGKATWGALFEMLTDKYGVQWIVNYDFKEKK